MPIYTSGNFLEIFFSQKDCRRKAIEKLRKWAGGKPEIEIFPANGTSYVVKIICSDSSSDWEKFKEEARVIIEEMVND